MDDELGLSYLINHFDKYTIPKQTAQTAAAQTAVQIAVQTPAQLTSPLQTRIPPLGAS